MGGFRRRWWVLVVVVDRLEVAGARERASARSSTKHKAHSLTPSLTPNDHALLQASVEHLPIDVIASGALAMSPEDFKDEHGFEQPGKEQPIVFSCAAGVRSKMAQQLADQAGYKVTTNYLGGAHDWFQG